LLALPLFVLVMAPAALAALTVTRAELSSRQVRVEGSGAVPKAPIAVDGTVMGTAALDGHFRIERTGFSSPTCRIPVSDRATSAEVTLCGCTPAGTPQTTSGGRAIGNSGQLPRAGAPTRLDDDPGTGLEAPA
jgi:hypothetical protein